jgi:hypothetical protein
MDVSVRIDQLEEVVHALLKRVQELERQLTVLRNPHVRPTMPVPEPPTVAVSDDWAEEMTTPLLNADETRFVDPFGKTTWKKKE